MNEKKNGLDKLSLLDSVALAILRLGAGGTHAHEHPLVRIANPPWFNEAPWVLDSVTNTIHVRGCRAIPEASRSALYAIHELDSIDSKVQRCTRCRTMKTPPVKQADTGDILFGVLSLFDQFGAILRERGSEFRQSSKGKELEKSLAGVMGKIDNKNKGIGRVIVSALDQLLSTVHTLSEKTGSNTVKTPPKKATSNHSKTKPASTTSPKKKRSKGGSS
jgi:hypothetical protein